MCEELLINALPSYTMVHSHSFPSLQLCHTYTLPFPYTQALRFEHRDLHWGNVLVQPTTETSVAVTLNGTTHHIPSEGVRATIIDYTLSRMEIGGLKALCPPEQELQ